MIGQLWCFLGRHDLRHGLYRQSCRRCGARWTIDADHGVIFWRRVK